MPTTTESLIVRRRSTATFAVSFFDENNNPVTPTEVLWSLYDLQGNVINGRLDVVEVSSSTVNIVLTADDLDMVTEGKYEHRFILIEYKYTSSITNNIVGANETVSFVVENVIGL